MQLHASFWGLWQQRHDLGVEHEALLHYKQRSYFCAYLQRCRQDIMASCQVGVEVYNGHIQAVWHVVEACALDVEFGAMDNIWVGRVLYNHGVLWTCPMYHVCM